MQTLLCYNLKKDIEFITQQRYPLTAETRIYLIYQFAPKIAQDATDLIKNNQHLMWEKPKEESEILSLQKELLLSLEQLKTSPYEPEDLLKRFTDISQRLMQSMEDLTKKKNNS